MEIDVMYMRTKDKSVCWACLHLY